MIFLSDFCLTTPGCPAPLLGWSPPGWPLLGSPSLAAPASTSSAGTAGTSSPPGLRGSLLILLDSLVSSFNSLVSSLLLGGTGGGDSSVGSEVGDSLIVGAPLPPLAEVEEAPDVGLPVTAIVELLTTRPLGIVSGLVVVNSVEVVLGNISISLLPPTSSLHPPRPFEGSCPGSSSTSAPLPWLGLSLGEEDAEEDSESDEKADTDLHPELSC